MRSSRRGKRGQGARGKLEKRMREVEREWERGRDGRERTAQCRGQERVGCLTRGHQPLQRGRLNDSSRKAGQWEGLFLKKAESQYRQDLKIRKKKDQYPFHSFTGSSFSSEIFTEYLLRAGLCFKHWM